MPGGMVPAGLVLRVVCQVLFEELEPKMTPFPPIEIA